MTPFFFFGTLRDPALLEIVLGRDVAPGDIAPAQAPGHAVRALADHAYPGLVPDPASIADGNLVRNLDMADIERLAYFEEAEYSPAPITVLTGGTTVDARFFRAAERFRLTGEPWGFAAWAREERAVAHEAARELMAHIGIVPREQNTTLWHGIMIRARMRVRARGETPVTGALRPPRGTGDVISEAIERPYTRYFAIEEHRLRHRQFDGTLSEPVERTVLMSGDAVTIVPYDPAADTVMLIEQFRAPMFARGDACPWGIEAIAGRVDKELDAEACARREAIEEGGIELGEVETIACYYSTPGIAAEHITSFVGHARLAGQGGVYGIADENEDIRAFIVGLDEALAAAASGEINNAPAILTLFWLRQNRARLRAVWK